MQVAVATLALCVGLSGATEARAVTASGPNPATGNNSGLGNHQFRIGYTAVVTCSNVSVRVTHNGSTITADPTFRSCSANIGGIPFPATVDSCVWYLTPLTLSGTSSTWQKVLSSTVGASCPFGKAMEMRIGTNCRIHIPGQTLSHGWHGSLAGQNWSTGIRLALATTYIAGSTTACPLGVPTSFIDGRYTGSLLLAGFAVVP